VSQYNARMVGIIVTYSFGKQLKKPQKTKNTDSNPLGGDD